MQKRRKKEMKERKKKWNCDDFLLIATTIKDLVECRYSHKRLFFSLSLSVAESPAIYLPVHILIFVTPKTKMMMKIKKCFIAVEQ